MTDVGVGRAYRHAPKRCDFRDVVEHEDKIFKYYHLAAEERSIPAEIDVAARASLASQPLPDGAGAGFVITHSCGEDFYFLLTTLWRGNNEAWEAVYYLAGDMPRFAPFDPAYPPAGPRPTFCVWELGIVAHESAAWTRCLSSARTARDLEEWKQDTMYGQI